VFELLAQTTPGAGGEIQLTDALDALLAHEAVEAFHMAGQSYDCGDKLGYLRATLAYGLRHPELGESFRTLVEAASQ
jgi:UTP--glucose-1-phosphate uridylyltransferase